MGILPVLLVALIVLPLVGGAWWFIGERAGRKSNRDFYGLCAAVYDDHPCIRVAGHSGNHITPPIKWHDVPRDEQGV